MLTWKDSVSRVQGLLLQVDAHRCFDLVMGKRQLKDIGYKMIKAQVPQK